MGEQKGLGKGKERVPGLEGGKHGWGRRLCEMKSGRNGGKKRGGREGGRKGRKGAAHRFEE